MDLESSSTLVRPTITNTLPCSTFRHCSDETRAQLVSDFQEYWPRMAVTAGATLGGIQVELLDPLERAAGSGDTQVTAALLASGATVSMDENAAEIRPLHRTVLHWASIGGNPDVVQAVLQAVAPSHVFENGQLHAIAPAAVEAAVLDALEATCLSKLPTRVVDGTTAIDVRDGTTALHLAVEGGHVAAVVVLLEAGADDTIHDGHSRTPLSLAVEGGHAEIVFELLHRGRVHIDTPLTAAENGTALHMATWNGNVAITDMLLNEGAAVNRHNFPDHTPLHYAATCGPNAGGIIHALVAAGADVDSLAEFYGTPLDMAIRGKPAYYRDPGVYDPAPAIRALVAVGADPHKRACNTTTAVENAVCKDDVETLSLFLELGVDPNHRRPFNQPISDLSSDATPSEKRRFMAEREKYGGASYLHLAARFLNNSAVELLLAAGAREDIPAFRDAKREDSPEVASLPADVIGEVRKETTPENKRRASAIRSMLAGAHLYRKGWLSVLRARFNAGESLTGRDDGGKAGYGGDRSDTEGPSPRRQKGAAAASIESGGSVSGHFDVIDVEDGAWYGAAVWLASVPGQDVFRNVIEFL